MTTRFCQPKPDFVFRNYNQGQLCHMQRFSKVEQKRHGGTLHDLEVGPALSPDTPA